MSLVSGYNAIDILLRTTKRDAGARRGAQDGVLEGEDQTGTLGTVHVVACILMRNVAKNHNISSNYVIKVRAYH